jgi:competence protein ComEC
VPSRTHLGDGEFEVWMFDVGQGLSVLVRSEHHAWLYDAGPRYPSGFDVGEAAVVPSLRALGITALDGLIVSHGDSDHAGGARALSLAFPGVSMLSGEPDRLDVAARPCETGVLANVDGVHVRVVVAERGEDLKSNDRSCVVLVSGSHGSLLLTGDATIRIESAILGALGEVSRPLVLTVPHHGSKTASSAAFLDGLKPELGLVSAGYRNQFGHPHADVLQRYAERRIRILGTADSGYLHLRFAGNHPTIEVGRDESTGWWRLP